MLLLTSPAIPCFFREPNTLCRTRLEVSVFNDLYSNLFPSRSIQTRRLFMYLHVFYWYQASSQIDWDYLEKRLWPCSWCHVGSSEVVLFRGVCASPFGVLSESSTLTSNELQSDIVMGRFCGWIFERLDNTMYAKPYSPRSSGISKSFKMGRCIHLNLHKTIFYKIAMDL